MKNHHALSCIVLFFIIGFLCSCQSSQFFPQTTSSLQEHNLDQTQITLNFWHTYSEKETNIFENEVLPLFHEQYPHIKIVPKKEFYSEQLKDTIIAATIENNSPDIMRLDMIWVPELAKHGMLEPVSQFASFSTKKQEFIGTLLETNHYNGEYYGIPVNANTKTAIFNKALLLEAGLTKAPTTFSELNLVREKLLSKYPNLSSVGICCTSTWGTLSYFWTLGGELTNSEFTQATGYLDSEQSIAALKKFKQWYEDGIIGETIITGEPGTWDGLIQNQFLMIDEAHWFYTVRTEEEQEQLRDQTIIALFPSDVQQGTSIIGGENLVIFSNTEYREEAWLFLEWMTTSLPQSLMANTGLISPLITNQSSANEVNISNQQLWYTDYLIQINSARPRPTVNSWSEVDDEFSRMIERILYNELTVEDATRQSAQRINELLK